MARCHLLAPLPFEAFCLQAERKVHREACFLADPVERLVRPVDFSARSIKDRRASLTASSVENTLATSGLRSTRLVPLRYSSKYFPRTPTPRSSRLYSGRSSSETLAFLIDHPFFAAHRTRAYYSR